MKTLTERDSLNTQFSRCSQSDVGRGHVAVMSLVVGNLPWIGHCSYVNNSVGPFESLLDGIIVRP